MWDGVFKRCLADKGGNLMNRIIDFIRRGQKVPVSPSAMRSQRKDSQSKFSPDTECPRALILDFPEV